MTGVAWALTLAAAAFVGYTYALYPLVLRVLPPEDGGPDAPSPGDGGAPPGGWPSISITVPVHDEAEQVRDTIESLLRVDYPADRRQILFVSDASTDGTDEIVREYADRGVDLLRVERRGGKTAAENAAREHLTGQIVVNTDASIRLRSDAVRALVRRFVDPTVGVASGRDVSAGSEATDRNVGESGYVGYEMWVRGLETRAGGIVGASGSLYAIRRSLHQYDLPPALSRDFAAALVAREHGYRAVSVPEAVCVVPRTGSLRSEYGRKVRTMLRGIATLAYKRHLLNPREHGRFAWMLFSHKVCRWLVPWWLVVGVIGAAGLAVTLPAARIAVGLVGAGLLLGAVGWLWPEGRRVPRLFSLPAFGLVANAAALAAGIRAVRGELHAVWEPTRRDLPCAP